MLAQQTMPKMMAQPKTMPIILQTMCHPVIAQLLLQRCASSTGPSTLCLHLLHRLISSSSSYGGFAILFLVASFTGRVGCFASLATMPLNMVQPPETAPPTNSSNDIQYPHGGMAILHLVWDFCCVGVAALEFWGKEM